MSADNGIYILRTLIQKDPRAGSVWRVAHLAAIDNLNWDDTKKDMVDDDDICIINARKMFAGAEEFYNEVSALIQAKHQLDQLSVCEYGISEIKINRVF